jgi:hypothetical protein
LYSHAVMAAIRPPASTSIPSPAWDDARTGALTRP